MPSGGALKWSPIRQVANLLAQCYHQDQSLCSGLAAPGESKLPGTVALWMDMATSSTQATFWRSQHHTQTGQVAEGRSQGSRSGHTMSAAQFWKEIVLVLKRFYSSLNLRSKPKHKRFKCFGISKYCWYTRIKLSWPHKSQTCTQWFTNGYGWSGANSMP